MRSLFLFIIRHHYQLIFLLLITISLWLTFTFNNYQRAAFVSSSSRVAGSVNETVSGITGYVNLGTVNRTLAEENARLKSSALNAYFNSTPSIKYINDTLYRQQYVFIAARVINNSVNRRNNYMTLNRGKVHGVQEGMGVISSNGIAGIVKDVSEHYSSVFSVLHKNFKTGARLAGSNYAGNFEWPGGHSWKGRVTEIPNHVRIKTGDTLVTTAASAVFPDGVMIGTIEDFEIKPGENFYTISVRIATNFRNLGYVYIVNNLMKGEQKELEERSQKDERLP